MNKKDNRDDGPGLIAILIIIVLVAVGLYYFFSHRPPTALNVDDNPNAPLEAPASINHDGGDKG